ncbi:MAG: amidase [Thermoflavifilum sp.]|nr:amidase [Thermoflavifilum sp.]MCL6513326.1 amidase [Alicyclobacillus sp.]
MTIHLWDIRRTQQAYESGETSAEEVTRWFLERIRRYDPDLGAFVAVNEHAVEEARRIDEARKRGDAVGPLAGIVVAIKDLLDTAGLRTGYGGWHFRDHVPSADATVVRRLKAAGAIVIGKTNLHEYAYGTTTENPHYGTSRNPWDRGRIAGGSSGGSAVAVAAGLCCAAIGTDTGGSIRIPAAVCGHVGLKPTYGRVSKAGVFPLASSLDHVGPMTRTVADAALLLQVMAGPDPADPTTATVPVPEYDPTPASGEVRVGVPRQFFFEQCNPAVRDVVRTTLERLQALGFRVVEVDIPDIDQVPAMQQATIASEALAVHEERLRETPERFGEDVRTRLASGTEIRGVDYVRAQAFRQGFRAKVMEILSQVDVIATPTTPITATPIGAAYTEVEGRSVHVRGHLTRYTNPWNLSGLPAITLPCGLTPDGLPVGLQLVGPAWGERKLLRVAARVEEITPWQPVAPAYRGI